MKFNYNKLKGKIIEVCGSQREFAEKINLSERSLVLKLSGKVEWKQSEMLKALEILNLGLGELPVLFFGIEEREYDTEIIIDEKILKEAIHKEFENRLIGYETPLANEQTIYKVIKTLRNSNVTISQAESTLNDVSKIIRLITKI